MHGQSGEVGYGSSVDPPAQGVAIGPMTTYLAASEVAPIRDAAVPAVLIKVASRLIVEASAGLIDRFGYGREDLIGTDATRYLASDPNPAFSLLATGQIIGYETAAVLLGADGAKAEVHIWAHAFGSASPPELALAVVDETAGALPRWQHGGGGSAVFGSVNADWRVDRVTADVTDLLGYEPSRVVGTALLAAVHPGDLAELLSGVSHAVRSGRSVVVRVRVQDAEGEWHLCRASLASLGETGGLAFVLTPAVPEDGDVGAQLREHLWRIAYELQAARLLPHVPSLPTCAELPGLSQLTTREWQVVRALHAGSRGSDIARDLNLAPSTVRNHLGAIYRKLGVTSQVGLLAALHGTTGEVDEVPTGS